MVVLTFYALQYLLLVHGYEHECWTMFTAAYSDAICNAHRFWIWILDLV